MAYLDTTCIVVCIVLYLYICMYVCRILFLYSFWYIIKIIFYENLRSSFCRLWALAFAAVFIVDVVLCFCFWSICAFLFICFDVEGMCIFVGVCIGCLYGL